MVLLYILGPCVFGIICGIICQDISIRKDKDSTSYFWLGFFLGFIGIIIALIHTSEDFTSTKINTKKQKVEDTPKENFEDFPDENTNEQTKLCPVCGYQLFPEDIVCPYCHTTVSNSDIAADKNSQIINNATFPQFEDTDLQSDKLLDKQIKQLQALDVLKKDGIITDIEFETLKNKIFGNDENLEKNT